jgi:hypothetical protein
MPTWVSRTLKLAMPLSALAFVVPFSEIAGRSRG